MIFDNRKVRDISGDFVIPISRADVCANVIKAARVYSLIIHRGPGMRARNARNERASVYKITASGKEDSPSAPFPSPCPYFRLPGPKLIPFFLPRNCSRDGEPVDLSGRKLR